MMLCPCTSVQRLSGGCCVVWVAACEHVVLRNCILPRLCSRGREREPLARGLCVVRRTENTRDAPPTFQMRTHTHTPNLIIQPATARNQLYQRHARALAS